MVSGESHVSIQEETGRMTHHVVMLLSEHLMALQAGKMGKLSVQEKKAKELLEHLEREERKSGGLSS